jgi:hypothetical protein
MKKELPDPVDDDLHPEYDLAKLGPGVRGKYYQQATAGPTVFLTESDVAEVLPAVGVEGSARVT